MLFYSKQKFTQLNAESLLKYQSLHYAVWATPERISFRAILFIGSEENPVAKFQGAIRIFPTRIIICCILTKLGVFPSTNKPGRNLLKALAHE